MGNGDRSSTKYFGVRVALRETKDAVQITLTRLRVATIRTQSGMLLRVRLARIIQVSPRRHGDTEKTHALLFCNVRNLRRRLIVFRRRKAFPILVSVSPCLRGELSGLDVNCQPIGEQSLAELGCYEDGFALKREARARRPCDDRRKLR